MPIAIDPKETVRFILEREREMEEPTVFLISPPTYRLSERLWNRAEVKDEEGGFSGGVPLGTALVMTCREHLRGWVEGTFKDKDGNPIEYSGIEGVDPAREEDLERLAFDDLAEIANAIRELGVTTETERGK